MGGPKPQRLIVGISGASGAAYGVAALRILRELGFETHLVMTRAAVITAAHELSLKVHDIQELASVVHRVDDIAACIASGSFQTLGMLVAPCSIRSLSEIAYGTTSNLLTRAADVVLKERRRLVLAVRESPLHEIHLEHMLRLSRMGVVIAPPVPAFYNDPKSVDDIVNHTVTRLLDLFGIHTDDRGRWDGRMDAPREEPLPGTIDV